MSRKIIVFYLANAKRKEQNERYILNKFEHTTFVWYKKVDRKLAETLSNFLLAVPRQLFCFDSLVDLDVVCGYFFLFVFEMKIENTFR